MTIETTKAIGNWHAIIVIVKELELWNYDTSVCICGINFICYHLYDAQPSAQNHALRNQLGSHYGKYLLLEPHE